MAAGDNAGKNERTYSAFWFAGKKSTALEAFKITATGLFYVVNRERETDAVCVCVTESECVCVCVCV